MRSTFLLLPFILLTVSFSNQAAAQNDDSDNLMNLLNDEQKTQLSSKDYTTATFKTTRVVNGHSIENTAKGVLDFKINHRFGRIDGGMKEFFGLDGATTMLGFDYGVTDWLTASISRNSYQKEYEGYLKAKILRQTTDNKMPLSLSYVGTMSVTSIPAPVLPIGQTYYFSNRLFYANQLLIARKFSNSLSFQLTPTHVHYNLVNAPSEPNNIFAMGIGGRVKVSSRITLNGEYYYVIGDRLTSTVNSLSLGVDIETGGHVFQLHFTNSTGMTQRAFVGQTTDKWGDGGIHFGFNISRVFTVVRPKEFKNTRNSIR